MRLPSFKMMRSYITQVLLMFLAMLHIISGIWGSPTALAFRHLFLGSMMIIVLMTKPLSSKRERLSNWLDMIMTLIVVGVVVYVLYDINAYMMRAGLSTQMDIFIGTVYMIVLLELARRVAGMAMVIIATFFFAQNCFAEYMPGIFQRANMSYTNMVDFVFMRTDGIFGMPTQVISTYVVLFMMFAALLEASGAGKFFIDFATAITGRSRGGPAKAAVVASAAFGSISGSAIANVAGTGCMTIPLMKRVGYSATFAGAVEAVASTGGQFMPPMMGAVAFILAQNIGMPYIQVAARATLPAVLYFICVFFIVDFRARRLNLSGTPESDMPSLRKTLKNGWQLVIPIVVIVYLLAIGKSAQYSALMAMMSLIIITFFRKWTRMTGTSILGGLVAGVKDTAGVAVTAAAAGIIIGGVTNTGLNLLFANQVLKISGGNLFFTLILVAIVSLVLGMGMTTSAVYISVATIMAPALIRLGITPISAHMFVLYFGCICVITPPVALASFTAAGISGANPSATGWTSFRIGLVAFIVPFIFVYQPVMLMYGSVLEITLVAVTSFIGCWGLAAAIEGWCSVRLNVIERISFAVGGLLMMVPGWHSDIVGLAILAAVYLLQKKRVTHVTLQ
ncbi:MAG: TRAP transporter permease [Clostridia bacterium]